MRHAAPEDQPVLATMAMVRARLSVLVNSIQDYIQVGRCRPAATALCASAANVCPSRSSSTFSIPALGFEHFSHSHPWWPPHTLQVDVISLRFGLLLQQLRDTTDFGAVVSAHEEFLASIEAAAFRHMKPVRDTLAGLMQACGELVAITRRAAGPATLGRVELARLQDKVDKQAEFLLRILSATKATQLAPLLLRMDYNHVRAARDARTGPETRVRARAPGIVRGRCVRV